MVSYDGVVATPRNDQGNGRSVVDDRCRAALFPKRTAVLAAGLAEFPGLRVGIIGASLRPQNGVGSNRVPEYCKFYGNWAFVGYSGTRRDDGGLRNRHPAPNARTFNPSMASLARPQVLGWSVWTAAGGLRLGGC